MSKHLFRRNEEGEVHSKKFFLPLNTYYKISFKIETNNEHW